LDNSTINGDKYYTVSLCNLSYNNSPIIDRILDATPFPDIKDSLPKHKNTHMTLS